MKKGKLHRSCGKGKRKEETGLDVEIHGVAWHIEEVSPERGQRFVNYMIGKIVGGELALGSDPELEEGKQVLREVKFLSRDEIGQLSTYTRSF